MKIISKSIVDQVQAFLEEQIFTGKLQPNDRIYDTEIAAQLRISRNPIREALKGLETDGLITRKPRVGVFVTEVTKQDVWEIYTFLGALWGMALRVAMEKGSNLWVDKLERTVCKMQACAENEPVNIRRFQTVHETFHGEATVMAGNKRVQIICDKLLKQIRGTTAKRFMDREHLRSSMSYHLKIFEAIKANDTDLAVKLTWEHIVDAYEALNKCYFTIDESK